ncbi:MAG: TolC family outer membrane protein [Rhodocyclaceae bacterium]|nr:TolC family outer membrane protein [Rhodocyclaceae bacterium]
MRRLVAVLVAGAWSAGAWSADLMQTYREALANDAQFAGARAQREADQEKLPQGRAGLLPTIGLAANSTFNDFDVSTQGVDLTRRGNTNAQTLQLSQPLFRWQNWVQFKQGELQALLGDVRLGQARQDLILRVAQAYFDVLNGQDALAAVSTLREAAGQQLELAKKSFEVGTVTITDVHEAQSRFDLASAQEIAAGSDLDVKRQVLAQIVGKPPEALAGLRKGLELPRPQPERLGDWVQAAEAGNFGVQAQQLALEIADREVERNRAGHYPTVDLVASYGHNNSLSSSLTPGSMKSDGSTLGVQLNVPLFAGGATSSRQREAVALKQRSLSDLDNARRSAALAARQSYLGVTSGLAQVKALEAAEISSTSALESNKLGYEVGVRINIDVLNAQSQLADARRQLAKARYDTLVAQLRLKAAAGTLAEEDVLAINALLTQ